MDQGMRRGKLHAFHRGQPVDGRLGGLLVNPLQEPRLFRAIIRPHFQLQHPHQPLSHHTARCKQRLRIPQPRLLPTTTTRQEISARRDLRCIYSRSRPWGCLGDGEEGGCGLDGLDAEQGVAQFNAVELEGALRFRQLTEQQRSLISIARGRTGRH